MEGRKRLYHWLRRNVEAENFGLKWVDKEEQLFRIPWIHKRGKGWNQSSCQLFKEWAKVTNRYREGEVEDWPAWKTRLRTALTRLPYFEEVHDMHRLENTDFPYKVYRFVPRDKPKDISDSASNSGGSPACWHPVEFSPSHSQRVDVSPNGSQRVGVSPSYSQCVDVSPNGSQRVDVSPSHSQRSRDSPSPAYYFDALSPSFTPEFTDTLFQQDDQEAKWIPNFLNTQPENWNIPVSNQAFGAEPDNQPQHTNISEDRLPSDLVNVNLMEYRLPSNEIDSYKSVPKKPMAEFKLYYLNEQIVSGTVYDSGVHCYFGQLFDIQSTLHVYEEMFGPRELEKFEFPDINKMSKSISHEQQNFLEDILLKLDRGFLLQFDENGSMYAKRLCRTRVFANNPLLGESSVCLDRRSKIYTKVFDMEAFNENMTTSPVVTFTFAQDFKKSDSPHRILMRMELSHLEAQVMQEKLAPPSKTGLQFSDFNSGDHLLHQIKTINLG